MASLIHPIARLSDCIFRTHFQDCKACKSRKQKLNVISASVEDKVRYYLAK